MLQFQNLKIQPSYYSQMLLFQGIDLPFWHSSRPIDGPPPTFHHGRSQDHWIQIFKRSKHLRPWASTIFKHWTFECSVLEFIWLLWSGFDHLRARIHINLESQTSWASIDIHSVWKILKSRRIHWPQVMWLVRLCRPGDKIWSLEVPRGWDCQNPRHQSSSRVSITTCAHSILWKLYHSERWSRILIFSPHRNISLWNHDWPTSKHQDGSLAVFTSTDILYLNDSALSIFPFAMVSWLVLQIRIGWVKALNGIQCRDITSVTFKLDLQLSIKFWWLPSCASMLTFSPPEFEGLLHPSF